MNVLAPMHCKVVGINVKIGDKVELDQPLFTIEAMKVEMPILSPCSGIVTRIDVSVDQTLDSDQIMAQLDEFSG